MLSFDTNILVYAANRQAGPRHIEAANMVAAASSGAAVLNHQSLVEFIHIMTRKQKLTVSDATLMVRAWLKSFPLITAPAQAIDQTLSLLGSYSLSVWDAHMLAICEAHGCDALLSEDMADGMLYGTVRVLNPFNMGNIQTIRNLLLP